MRLFSLTLVFAWSTLLSLPAADPIATEKAVVDAFREAVVALEAVYDEQGHVIKLAVSNHKGTPRGKAGNQDAPGLTADVFARILELPNLQAIAIEKQPLGDDSYALLGQLKQLTDVRLQSLAADSGATPNAPLFINDLPLPLTVLELKHHFSIKGSCMSKLKPQPELIKLELDNGFAGPDALPFLQHCGKVENLQLHRTSMSDEQFQQAMARVPALRILEVRPNSQPTAGFMTSASLRALKACPQLEQLFMSQQWKSITFEGGLDALVGLKNLKIFTLDPSDLKEFSIQDEAIQKLHTARPDILIQVKKKSLGGHPEAKLEAKDGPPWDWDKGVNTHG